MKTKLLCTVFCSLIFLCLNAYGQQGLSLQATKLTPERVVITNNGQEYFKTVLRSANDAWKSDIVNIQWQKKTLTYEIVGWYSSAGLAPKQLRLQREVVTVNNGWDIIYIPKVTKIAGKESSLVTGYNYTSKEKLKPLKGMTHLKIVLKDANGNIMVEKNCNIVEQSCS